MVMHKGVSVTQRVKETKQPRGGYVKRTDMTNTPLGGGEEELGPENIHSSLVGLAVDYLTRIMTGHRRKTPSRWRKEERSFS